MNQPLLEVHRPAQLSSVGELRQLLQRAIQAAVTEQKKHSNILLCLSEAASNVVIHGDANQLTLRFGRNHTGWWLTLDDDGSPWQPNTPPNNDLLERFSLDENGRGIALMSAQSDELNYRPRNQQHGNQLTLKWRATPTESRPTILVVEDDPSLRRLYRAYLSDSFQIIEAESGQQALERIAQENIELILSDIHMPDMNGLGLRTQLEQQPQSRLIPFVFLTASSNQQTQQRASELGIDDYLLKPVEKKKLLQTIQRVLSRNQQISRQLTERIDQRISASLAPKLPNQAHGWQLAVAHRNTGVGGGDFLLYKQYDEQLLLTLSDIMGHDDSAKFFSYAYAGYLRGLMHSMQNNAPEQLLTALSDSAFEDDLLSQITLTCCCATLSQGGEITFASAGHPAPLFISAEGVEPLPVGGMMPGLMPAAHYQPLTKKLQPGERIALYTDGLFDSASSESDREQLEAKIKECLHNSCKQPLQQALDQVMALFDQIASTSPKDDALLILLEPQPSFANCKAHCE